MLGAASLYRMRDRKIESTGTWTRSPGYAFCLYLSLENFYRTSKRRKIKSEYSVQGRLFESLAYESLNSWGWSAEKVGWSPRHAVRLRELLPGLAATLGEDGATDLDFHIPTCANDGGLDLVLHRSFPDGWGARPVLLLQCASGWSTWEGKLGTPHPNLWDKLVRFPWPPMTGIIIPFALTKKGLYQVSEVQAGVVIDRLRLLSALHRGSGGISRSLQRELSAWLRPRIAWLKGLST